MENISSLGFMTAAEKIYELVKQLPMERVNEVLDFAEFLHQKESHGVPSATTGNIPPETLAKLRDLAKGVVHNLNDEELQSDYINYLTQKYQL